MPPKRGGAASAASRPAPKSKGKFSAHAAEDTSLDDLVKAIEGISISNTAAEKKGMTKRQKKLIEEKGVADAIRKLQPPQGATITPQQWEEALMHQRLRQEQAIRAAQYVNVPVALSDEQRAWIEVAENKYIRYEQFDKSEEHMDFIVKLFTKELTEPYSSFTYQYFVYGWPDLSIIAYGVESAMKPDSSVVGTRVGAVVSRVTRKGPGRALRGYVAMFAVVPEFRGFRLGSRLVALTIQLMKKKDCDEVYLETPTSNERALSLYTGLGFAKIKFLPRYYLDGSDAVRLKIWLKDALLSAPSGQGSSPVPLAVGAAVETTSAGPAVDPPE